MRDDDIKAALKLFSAGPLSAAHGAPVQAVVNSASLIRKSDPPPPLPEGDDPYALPRFREPPLFLPDHQRTFLRAIAVKPRQCFFTWDVQHARRRSHAQLQVRALAFLGDPPDADALWRQPISFDVRVEIAATGWYLPLAPERLCVVAQLVDDEGIIASSNVTLTPPARPAAPGPLWVATLPPSFDRRLLLQRRLLTGAVDEARFVRVGQSDARDVGSSSAPSSFELFRISATPSSSASGGVR